MTRTTRARAGARFPLPRAMEEPKPADRLLLSEQSKAAHLAMVQEHRAIQFDAITERARALFVSKNEKYRDAFSAIGLLGTISELIGVAHRLKHYGLHSGMLMEDLMDEGALQLLRTEILPDLLNYSIMCQMLLEDENYLGI